MSLNKGFRFYAEIVVVTILSLVAAYAWVRVLYHMLDRYFSKNMTAEVIVAVIITTSAILISYMMFSKNKSPFKDLQTTFYFGKDTSPMNPK